MFNEVGSSALVSGFFWVSYLELMFLVGRQVTSPTPPPPLCPPHTQDDFWPGAGGGFPDASSGRIVEDTGMSPAELQRITDVYDANMDALKTVTLGKGKFAWQVRGGMRLCLPLMHSALRCRSGTRLCAAAHALSSVLTACGASTDTACLPALPPRPGSCSGRGATRRAVGQRAPGRSSPTRRAPLTCAPSAARAARSTRTAR